MSVIVSFCPPTPPRHDPLDVCQDVRLGDLNTSDQGSGQMKVVLAVFNVFRWGTGEKNAV